MLLLVLLVVVFIAIISMLFFYQNVPSAGNKPRCCGGRNENCPMCRCGKCGEIKQNCGCPYRRQRSSSEGCPFC